LTAKAGRRGHVVVHLNFDAYPVQSSLGVLGRKWAFLILMNIALGRARRFSEMRRTAPGMSKRILAIRLSELEKDGFIAKEAGPNGRADWSLAQKGVDVLPVLLTLIHFGSKWRPSSGAPGDAIEALAPTFRVGYSRAKSRAE
jgi:DNA-binding HxlR family transcriptional regulator